MIIRKFKLKDIEQIKHLQPEGWDDIKHFFRFFYEQSFCHPVVAIVDHKIVGVANGILNDGTGWLSHIIVDHDYRGRGIGYKLTEHIMEFLSSHGCKTQLLIATELGEPVYRKLGFKTVTYYNFYKGPKLDLSVHLNNIRPLDREDVDAIYDLDREITGEIRKNMLQNYLLNGWVFQDQNSTNLKGYYLSDMGEGLIVAKDNEAGLELLRLKHSLNECKTVLPQENKAGQAFLLSSGFTRFLSATRMLLGEEIKWRPELIFSRTGGYYG
jgi:GNAT superfamily N-acetyltransferase